MSLVSNLFLLFVAVSVLVYYIVPHKFQWLVLLCFSYIYYLAGGVRYVGFILFSTLVTWGIALAVEKAEAGGSHKSARNFLVLGLILNFGMLGVIKYTNFMIENLNALFHMNLRGMEILLPLGISFYTFQSSGYLLDVYWKRCDAERNPVKYALFVSFFPQILQGPIGRYSRMAHQLYEPHKFEGKNITIFGDGQEVGDTDGDGKTDYRVAGKKYIHGGPEFLSVIEDATGKELARTNYIALGQSEDWGDNYYKRSSSYRIGMARCSNDATSVIIGRGCYAKIVVEAWNFSDNQLSRIWRFDTTDGIHSDYDGQGYHSMSVGDVDNDGLDEIVYGSCTIDHNGKGLNCCGLGHGDALHLGKFDPSRKGLQIWSCFESGTVGAALRDANTGNVIWKFDKSGDVGRCLVADIDPDSPGCEMWWYKGNAHSSSGVDLGYVPSSCNMAVWFSGSLNRQLLDKGTVNSYKDGRADRL